MILLLMVFIISGCASFEEQDKQFTKEKKFDWCKKHAYSINSTHPLGRSFGDGEPRNVEWCYGEVWDMFCEVSYPEYCPDQSVTEKVTR